MVEIPPPNLVVCMCVCVVVAVVVRYRCVPSETTRLDSTYCTEDLWTISASLLTVELNNNYIIIIIIIIVVAAIIKDWSMLGR